MRMLILGLLLLGVCVEEADARRCIFKRRSRTKVVSRSYGGYANAGGTPQQVAERKLLIMVSKRSFRHIGGSFGGCRYEGIGIGSTPAQARRNCCYSYKAAAGSAVRKVGNRYWALQLYY